MEKFEFDSTNLLSGSYDSRTKKLIITFKRSLRQYEYSNVSQKEVDGLVSSSSPGKYFYSFIKGKYPTQEL